MKKLFLVLIGLWMFTFSSCFVPVVEAAITPTVLGTQIATPTGTTTTYQRKLFYANGRFWAFYSDDINLVYRTSTDGFSWNAAINVAAITTGDRFDVKFNGTYIYYARATEVITADVYIRTGTPQADGSITWLAAEQTVYNTPAGNYSRSPIIAIDSNNYPWVAFITFYAGNYSVVVTRSDTNDGTWTTTAGFPYIAYFNATHNRVHNFAAMDAGTLYLIYGAVDEELYGQFYDGGGWWAEEPVTTSSAEVALCSLMTDSLGNIHMTFLNASATRNIIYLERNATLMTWGTEEEIVGTTSSDSFPSITYHDSEWLIFWQNTKKIYYSLTHDSEWQGPYELSSQAINIWGRSVTSMIPSSDTDKVLVVWQDAASSPFEIRVMYLDIQTASGFITISEYSPLTNLSYTTTASEKRFSFTVTASSGASSQTRIHIDSLGEPDYVEGSSSWSYGSSDKMLTVQKTHASSANMIVVWGSAPAAASEGAATLNQFLLFLFEGDWLGFLQAIYISAFMSADLFYSFIILLIMAPIYIRTRSLILVCILWILIGSGLIVAAPMVAALGIAFMALGIAGVLLKIFTSLR